MVNLKHDSENLKHKTHQEELKTSSPKGQLRKSTKICNKKGASVLGGSLAPYLTPWLAMCLSEIASFEVDASLKWMPQQAKLKSGTCITKKKSQLSELTLQLLTCLW